MRVLAFDLRRGVRAGELIALMSPFRAIGDEHLSNAAVAVDLHALVCLLCTLGPIARSGLYPVFLTLS